MNESLEQRLAHLESSQRRLRRVAMGLGVALAVTGLTSLAGPLCKTVTAERFVLEDGHGRARIVLDAYSTESPTITLKDPHGEPVATFQEGADGFELKVFGDEERAIPLTRGGEVH